MPHVLKAWMILHLHLWVHHRMLLRRRRAPLLTTILPLISAFIVVVVVSAAFVCEIARAFVLVRAAVVLETPDNVVDV